MQSKNKEQEQADNSTKKFPSILVVITTNISLVVLFWIVIPLLLHPFLIPCFDPIAQGFLLALFFLALLHIFSSAITSLHPGWLEISGPVFFQLIGTKLLSEHLKGSIIVFVILAALGFWLGSYTVSPFYSKSGVIPIIRGFVVITSSGSASNLSSEGKFTVGSSSWATINPAIEPPDSRCSWTSARNGSFNNSQKCNTAYYPPLGFTDDLLELQVRSACQSQVFHGHLRVVILP